MDDTSLEIENKKLLEVLANKDRDLIKSKRRIVELESREDKFWITDAGKQRHTSGLPPDMVQMME